MFLCLLPPNMKNFFQPIDAGLGRSVRISVVRNFDEWLMNNDNISRWEGTMTSSERRILATIIVGKAIYEVMGNSKKGVCVAYFERTGLLITVIANENHDSKIRPQGMEKGKLCKPTEPVISLNLIEETEGQSEEKSASAEEKSIIDELTENEND